MGQQLDIVGEAKTIVELAESEWKHNSQVRVIAVGFATIGRLLGAILVAVSKEPDKPKEAAKSSAKSGKESGK